MRTMCEINRLIETGEITSFAQKAPHDVHSMDQGKYHGSLGMVNTPSSTEPFYYQVFKLGSKDRQVLAHGMQTGRTYQMIQHGGIWNAWKETDGRSAYQIWLDEGHTGNKAAFLASLKGAKGDTGSFTKTGFATHAEVVAGVNSTKPISPQGLNWGKLMSKGGSPSDKFHVPSNADLNTYTTLGMYHCGDGSANNKGKNYPPPHATAGMLVVMDDGGFIYQTFYTYGGRDKSILYSNVYHRSFYKSWTSWERQTSTLNDSFSGRSDRTIATSSAVNLDDLKEGWILINKVGSHNPPVVTGESYFYIMTIPYSDGKQNLQVAYGYSYGKTMGVRRSYQGHWTPWSYFGSMTLSGTTLTISL